VKRIKLTDLYDAWMLAAAESALALAHWRAAPRDEKAVAYASYVDALDREADAAWLLQTRSVVAA
jgi:hypothetical protein